MALPSGLIQIKGRRGFYTNITVPLKHRKTLGKSVIQKKAGDTLQEAQQKLWEEQSKARDLFQRLEQETPEGQLRARFREWQQIEAEQMAKGIEPTDLELSAEESLELQINEAVWPTADPIDPTEGRLSRKDRKLLEEAKALKEGLHHWEEWLSERAITSGGVSPLVEKRWRTVLKSFVEWSKEEYPERVEKKTAADYKRHLLTRTNRQGRTSKQSTVAKDIRDLSAAWKWATQHGFAKVNIWEGLARNLETSKPRSLPDKNTIREADERAAANTDLKYLIQRFTGCRKQGVCGLRKQDIDLEDQLIHFVEYEEEGKVRKLKGGQELHVPIHRTLLPFLLDAIPTFQDGPLWPEEYKAREESWGDRYGDSFKDRYGFNSHDLRRIVETQMAKANVSPYFAFYVTGHRVPGMSDVTTKYVRPTAEELRQVVELIE